MFANSLDMLIEMQNRFGTVGALEALFLDTREFIRILCLGFLESVESIVFDLEFELL